MNLPFGAATAAVLNITGLTALRTSAAWVQQINVLTAGAAGAIYDAAATGTATAGRQIAVIPATIGMFPLNFPCTSGVVVAPGAGQSLAITLA